MAPVCKPVSSEGPESLLPLHVALSEVVERKTDTTASEKMKKSCTSHALM